MGAALPCLTSNARVGVSGDPASGQQLMCPAPLLLCVPVRASLRRRLRADASARGCGGRLRSGKPPDTAGRSRGRRCHACWHVSGGPGAAPSWEAACSPFQARCPGEPDATRHQSRQLSQGATRLVAPCPRLPRLTIGSTACKPCPATAVAAAVCVHACFSGREREGPVYASKPHQASSQVVRQNKVRCHSGGQCPPAARPPTMHPHHPMPGSGLL
jgi:hypothetical protein